MTPEERLVADFKTCPPIVQAAIVALLKFERGIDEMGYDISYYQQDLPVAVANAIAPWKIYD